MNTRIIKALTMICVTGFFLTGCASTFPEMSQEEYDQVVQYSVSLLMKYSNNGVERLSSVSALDMQKQMEKEAREEAKAARDAELEEAIASGTVEQAGADTSEEETDLAMAETDDSDSDQSVTVDSGENDGEDIDQLLDEFGDTLDEGMKDADESSNSGDSSDVDTEDSSAVETTTDAETEDASIDDQLEELTENATTADSAESSQDESGEELTTETDATVDGMRQELAKGLFLTYSGYSVAGSYADENDVFSITANQGNKLLVLNFQLINTSGLDVSVDMVKTNPHFQVLLNDKNVGYTNVTMLDNDLSSFAGTIPAGDKVNMVLIKQMKADKVKTIDTLGLIGTLGDETITFNLE